MADKNITIGIKATGADEAANAVRKVDGAMDGLGGSANRTSVQTGKFSASQTKVQSGSKNSAAALLMFSQGFEDAQYGIRGVLNNIPGLVMALGGTMGVAGAISIAAVAISTLAPLLISTGGNAKELAENIKKVTEALSGTSEKAAEFEALRFENVGAAIDATKEKAEALKQKWTETKTAEKEFATASLDNSSKLAEAQRIIAGLLGEQVSAIKTLKAMADEEAAQRKLAAEQAAEAEKQKAVATGEEAAALIANQTLQQQRVRDEAERLKQLKEQLKVIKEERAELEKLAAAGKLASGMGRLIEDVQRDGWDIEAQAISSNARGNVARKGKWAQKQLDDPAYTSLFEITKKRVEELEKAVRTLSQDGGIIQKAENAAQSAITKLEDTNAAVTVELQKIETTLAADDLQARAKTAAETSAERAKAITEAVSQVETTNAVGETAKQTLLAAAATGGITADEERKVADSLQAIMGQLQAGLATTSGNTQQLLGLMRDIANQAAKDARDITTLQNQVGELFRRVRP